MPQSDSPTYLHPQSWDPMMCDVQTESLSTTMDDLFSFLNPPSESAGHDLLQGVPDQPTPLGISHLYPPTPRDSAQQSSGEEQSPLDPEFLYAKNPLFALSRLNHFLVESHLLLQTQSCPPPWRISMVDVNERTEFVDIVKVWTKSSKQSDESEKEKDEGRSFDFYNIPPAKYTLVKPTILMIISTYLLFVRMFDVIFSRLIFVLRDFPNEAAKVRFEPGFEMGGFPLPQGYLYLKIIVQAFEHQIEFIESSLGLPAEYRVSEISHLTERQEQDHFSVFNKPKYQILLKAAMTQALEDDDQEDENANEILRLREKLSRIKELLQRS
ncbi:hypothetical protein TSTA_112190 [Talaromyces stipitatus ATCC 10500]|uniref:Uncharacterized protein n=1 Tax=Talaromyces stipitatus (strain ATCC 10500 / CBS 375.48 / QM 6759 / NRRL 1006) TaxID=441959 RepID=B8M991_TALSN|nr:uncharacterized protein TSTA_112190 [Talaromyces stipitatus ATCC 10500]EED17386.1 hypothetical protein TSTA_112190 [Talaromyces stipitatus ATCC 10500]